MTMLLVTRDISSARDAGGGGGTTAAALPHLRAFVRRRRRFALLKAAGWAACFVLGWVLLASMMDRLLQLPRGVRVVLLLGALGGMVAIVLRHVLRLFAPIDYGRAAAQVERVNPVFAERLRTVVSRWSDSRSASSEGGMLGKLSDDVLREIERDPPERWIRWSHVTRPWAAAGGLLAVMVLVAMIPTMRVPRLVARLAAPLSDLPPVTTTAIDVRPGHVRLNRGQPLEIRARVTRLSRGGLDIYTSEDGVTWARVPMLPAKEDEYVFSLSSVDRDVRYFITGGDATTETFAVEVLRAPAVVEYHLRYEYPLYTERGAVNVTSSDGAIDAVVATRVRVHVVATEPLQSALLSIGGETRVMQVLADARYAETQFDIERSARADLELRSEGGLSSGTVRNALTINAIPDREPLVRVLRPLDDLRLHPRDVVGVGYQAMDDYGVLYLAAVVQTGSGAAPREFPIRRRGDLRRQEGEFFLDLATLDLRMGDVVTLSLLAQDGLGRRAQTESRNILISPRSIDINTYLRIAEMRQAARLAASARDELRAALSAYQQAQRRGDRSAETEGMAPRSRATEGLTNAVESTLLARQALLRAIGKSGSAAQTLVLARQVDRASVQAAKLERLLAMDAEGQREVAVIRELRPLLEPAARTASETTSLAEAEQASAILAERANVRGPSTRPADAAAAERLAETLRRAEQEIAADVRELNLEPLAPDLDETLRRVVDTGARIGRGANVTDFAVEAEAWVTQLRRSAVPLAPLAGRLAAAASVEAVRPDANPVIARDLQLASRATSRLVQSMLSWPEADRVFISHPVDEFPMAIRAVQREHALLRAAGPVAAAAPATPEAQHAARDAAAARAKLTEWATRLETSTGSEIAGDIMDEEELAMVASAETAMRSYEAAALTDRRLAEGASAPDEGSRVAAIGVAMQTVQEIDRLATDQRNLASQTEGLHDEERAAAMARDQQHVARQIESFQSGGAGAAGQVNSERTASGADSRRRATEAVQRVQEQLAHAPQRLAVAQDAADAYRAAVERADQARWRAEGAEEEQRAAAERAVELADRAAGEARERLTTALSHVNAEMIRGMSSGLQPFEPEATQSLAALTVQLLPAVEAFERVAHGGERPSVSRAAQRVRSAIEAAQAALSDAQAKLIESDPVVSAHWFAEAAARALAERPPDVPKAHRHQKTAAGALDHAWQNAVRDVSTQRLALAPGYRAILRSGATPLDPDAAVFRPFGELLPGLRQWGFLRTQTTDALAAPVQETEAPGYEGQLRVYFDTLSKAQQQRPQTRPAK